MSEIQLSATAGISISPTKPEQNTRSERVLEAERASEVSLQSDSVDTQNDKDNQDKTELVTEVKNNLEKLNTFIPVTATNLSFEFDEQGESPVVKVIDSSSEEVIREIPSEEFREMAKALDEFADKVSERGFLFNRTV